MIGSYTNQDFTAINYNLFVMYKCGTIMQKNDTPCMHFEVFTVNDMHVHA